MAILTESTDSNKSKEHHKEYTNEKETSITDDDEKSIKLYENKNIEITNAIRDKSLFYQKFLELHTNVLSKESEMIFTNDINEYHCPAIVNYILQYILFFYSMWSAVVIKKFYILRDLNQSVENNFKITKNYFFAKQKHIMTTRFIQQLEALVEGRIRELEYPRITEKQKISRLKKYFKRKSIIYYHYNQWRNNNKSKRE